MNSHENKLVSKRSIRKVLASILVLAMVFTSHSFFTLAEGVQKENTETIVESLETTIEQTEESIEESLEETTIESSIENTTTTIEDDTKDLETIEIEEDTTGDSEKEKEFSPDLYYETDQKNIDYAEELEKDDNEDIATSSDAEIIIDEDELDIENYNNLVSDVLIATDSDIENIGAPVYGDPDVGWMYWYTSDSGKTLHLTSNNGTGYSGITINSSGQISYGLSLTDKLVFKKIVIDDEIVADTAAYMFGGFLEITDIEGLDKLDTSQVTSMRQMFYNCQTLQSLDASSFNTSNVVDMSDMFTRCYSLSSLDISSFNTSNVTNMKEMFLECHVPNLDVSSFNTSNVTSMESMFYDCSSLTTLDLTSFDTRNVTNMANMFRQCRNLTTLDVSSFDTSNVTKTTSMFSTCSALTTIKVLDNLDLSAVTDSSGMFGLCTSLVGGNGTTIDGNPLDKTYAHIDEPGNPGYFTRKSITSISVDTSSTKTLYIVGDNFDGAGLVILVTYDDTSTQTVSYDTASADFTFTPSPLTAGLTQVTITYKGATTTQPVTVRKQVTEITQIVTPPTNTEYSKGDKFDPTGLVVKVKYNDDSTEDIPYNATTKDLFTFNPDLDHTFDNTDVGDKVEVSIGGVTPVTIANMSPVYNDSVAMVDADPAGTTTVKHNISRDEFIQALEDAISNGAIGFYEYNADGIKDAKSKYNKYTPQTLTKDEAIAKYDEYMAGLTRTMFIAATYVAPTPAPTPSGGDSGNGSGGGGISYDANGNIQPGLPNNQQQEALNPVNTIPQNKLINDNNIINNLQSYQENIDALYINARDDRGNKGFGRWQHIPNTTTWYFLSGDFNNTANQKGTVGLLCDGWYNLGWKGKDEWYHFDKAGTMQMGWFTENNKIYYLETDISSNWYGRMITGQYNINGHTYTFDSTGVLIQ